MSSNLSDVSMTPGYIEWRDTVARRDQFLFDALEKLTIPELFDAKNRLMGGLAAERLNPANSSGDFHFAAGIVRGLIFAKSRKPSPSTPQ